MRYLLCLELFLSLSFLSGCANLMSNGSLDTAGLTASGAVAKGPTAKRLKASGPVQIVFKPVLNHIDITNYYSRSTTHAYSDNELVKTLTDIANFTVKTKTVAVDNQNQTATYDLTTIKKTGLVDLSDFAMPDLGETLELMLTNQGKVLRAGNYPPGTLFFVPPVSLPNKPVKVGDSWPMTSEWVSLKSGLPLKMKTLSTLRAIRKCGTTGRCAEIDLTGTVQLEPTRSENDGSANKLPKFVSSMNGSLLFSLTRGTVLYSYLVSSESLSGKNTRIIIRSCMVSSVVKPSDENLLGSVPVQCRPLDQPPKY